MIPAMFLMQSIGERLEDSMTNDMNRDNDKQADFSKSQSAQQPRDTTEQARADQLDQQSGDRSSDPSGSDTGMADYGSAENADAMTQNRTGVEQSAATDKQTGGFVGSDSQSDTSSELVDSKDSEAPAGK